MGGGPQHTHSMKRLALILPLLLLLSGCFKDTVDVAQLTNNPFDREFDGEAVFVFEETFTEVVNIGTSNVVYQVIVFRVREELFLAPTAYGIRLDDLQNGQLDQPTSPVTPGSSRYRYRREPAPAVPICLRLRLTNNQGAARADTICATL